MQKQKNWVPFGEGGHAPAAVFPSMDLPMVVACSDAGADPRFPVRGRRPPTWALFSENHGSHQNWKSGKIWKNGKTFSSQGKVREFCQDWKSQGILLTILENLEKFILEN